MVVFQKDMATEVRENMRGGKGNVHFVHMMKEELPANMRVFAQITLAPGESIGKHTHMNETEFFYFIAGEGTVMDDDTPVKVHAGDAMATSSGHAHAVENTGAADLVMVAVIVKDVA